MYLKYNDYELLYLYKDGNEFALNILLEKYGLLIKKVCGSYFSTYSDKYDDLVQEGYLILYKCIDKYRDDQGATFYTYFMLCLNRALYKESKDPYYRNYFVCDQSLIDSIEDFDCNNRVKSFVDMFDDEICREIYLECYVGYMSLHSFSIKYNYPYPKVYAKSKYIESELKKLLTIELF